MIQTPVSDKSAASRSEPSGFTSLPPAVEGACGCQRVVPGRQPHTKAVTGLTRGKNAGRHPLGWAAFLGNTCTAVGSAALRKKGAIAQAVTGRGLKGVAQHRSRQPNGATSMDGGNLNTRKRAPRAGREAYVCEKAQPVMMREAGWCGPGIGRTRYREAKRNTVMLRKKGCNRRWNGFWEGLCQTNLQHVL